MTEPEIAILEKMAEANDGHCDRCGQTIKIYRHKPNAHHAKMLRRLASVVEERQRAELMTFSEANQVNFNDIDGEFSEKSQRTKMRQHGLIAKVREDGKHVANTWLITNKGFSFLSGQPIPATVVVYDNQVLGHEGGTITINQLLDEPSVFQQEAISTPEAEVYGQARKPKAVTTRALYRGMDGNGLKRGVTYDIRTGKLQVGKSLQVSINDGIVHDYKDIASFQRNWKVIK